MSFHLTLSRIPELSRLSEQQLRLVDLDCLRPILLRTKIRVAKFVFLFPFWFLALGIIPWFWTELSHQVAVMLFEMPILYGLDYLFDMVMFSVNRQRIAEFVSEHENELR